MSPVSRSCLSPVCVCVCVFRLCSCQHASTRKQGLKKQQVKVKLKGLHLFICSILLTLWSFLSKSCTLLTLMGLVYIPLNVAMEAFFHPDRRKNFPYMMVYLRYLIGPHILWFHPLKCEDLSYIWTLVQTKQATARQNKLLK